MSQTKRVRVTELEQDQARFLQRINEQAIYQHLSERLASFERIEHIVANLNRYQSAERRLDSLLRAFVYTAPATQQGMIYLNAGPKGDFIVGATFPRQLEQLGATIDASDGYIDAVAEVKSATLLDDIQRDALARHPRHVTDLREAQSALVIPFVAGGRTAGVLTLENCDRTNAFAQQDLDFAVLLSLYATMAVDLARITVAHPDVYEPQSLNVDAAQTLAAPLPTDILLDTQESTSIDVNNLIRQLAHARLYARQHSRLGIKLSLVEPAPMIWGHAQQLQLMLLNLIDNAEQACASVCRDCEIHISTERVEDRVQVLVHDNGPGIAPEAQDHIQEQLATTKHQDRALGLAACRQIASNHNARIWFKDSPGRGTTFTIEFTVDSHPKKPAGNPVSYQTKPAAPPARILVVDDETSITRLLYKVLTLNGHAVDSAATGHQALSKIQQERYDIVFLDLKIPGMPGQTIYNWIKDHRSDLLSRTVILTGDTLNDDTMHFLDQEQAVRLLKPFELGELRSLMQCIWPA